MGSDRETLVRIAHNQSLFREANERIEATAEGMGLLDPIPFVCECADPGCTEIVRLSLDDYETVRTHGRRFFVVPGHQVLSLQHGAGEVVGETPEFVLVDKIGVAGEVAEERFRDLAEESGAE
jgi:hypothetical protein